jgi:hypothetical protein
MVTVSTARNAASQYLQRNLPGSVDRLEFVGMTATPEGSRLGYEVRIDRGFSLGGAIVGGLVIGLVGVLLAILLFLLLTLFGVPPSLSVLGGLVLGGGGVYLGGRAGGDLSEMDNVTVTVNEQGDVVMMNTDLSSGEFSRAIGREYDRQTAQFDGAVSEVSKHWLLHKVVDKFLGRND